MTKEDLKKEKQVKVWYKKKLYIWNNGLEILIE